MRVNIERTIWRANRKDNSELIQGYPVGINDTSYIVNPIGTLGEILSCNYTIIDPDTLLQCTAMHDKNKTLVFEGDKVIDNKGEQFKIVWAGEGFWKQLSDGRLMKLSAQFLSKSEIISQN